MRKILIATILSAFSLVLVIPSYADENQSDRVRDLIAETAKVLNDDAVSPGDKADAINRLREQLNSGEPRRERAEAAPSDRQVREREMDRQRQDQLFERLEQARREFDEAIRRLESLPRQGRMGPPPTAGTPPGDRRGEDGERRMEQPDRRDGPHDANPRDANPSDQRDARPMEPPRFFSDPFGSIPNRQSPPQSRRFSIGIAFLATDDKSSDAATIDRVMEQSPAEEAGLRKGDVVVGANGRELSDPRELAEMVQKVGEEGREIQLKIRREDQELDFSLRPRLTPEQERPQGFGSISVWEMIPGQPPTLGRPFPPGGMPPGMGPNRGELEELRRQMETMQRQIDELRNQLNSREETDASIPQPDEEDI